MTNLHFILGAEPPAALLSALRGFVETFPERTLSFASWDDWKNRPPSENTRTKTLVIFSITTKNEFLALAPYLTAQLRNTSDSKPRFLTLNGLTHPSVPPILRSQGCEEILAIDVDPRTLARRIRALFDQMDAEIPREKTRYDSQIFEIEALSSHWPDWWLIDRTTQVKSVLGKWLIEAQGPSTSEGEWRLISAHPLPSGDEVWEWQPRTEHTHFKHFKYRFRFFGQRPEFQWKNLRWHFVGKDIALKLYDQEKPIEYRLAVASGSLTLRANSEQARALIPEMEKSYAYGEISTPARLPTTTAEPATRNEFKRCAENLRPVGVTAFMDAIPIEILSQEREWLICSGAKDAFSQLKESQNSVVRIDARTISPVLERLLELRGEIHRVDGRNSDRVRAVIRLDETARSEIARLWDSLEEREKELHAFFTRTQGLD